MVDTLKRLASETFEFFFTKVVNWLSILFIMIIVLGMISGNPISLITTNIVFKSIFVGMMLLSICSIAFYSVYDVFLNTKLFLFVSKVCLDIVALNSIINNKIKTDMTRAETLKHAEEYANDEKLINYFGNINVVSTFESMSFLAANFGYVLIPILGMLNLIDYSTFIPTGILSVIGNISVICMFGIVIRYFSSYFLALISNYTSETYNKIIEFHRENN